MSLILAAISGIPINRELCETTLRDFKLKAVDSLLKASEIVKPLWDDRLGTFNINSPKDKSAILFGGTYQIKVKEENGYYKNGKIKYKNVLQPLEIKGFGLNPILYSTQTAFDGRYQTGADIIKNIKNACKNETIIQYCSLQHDAMNYNKMCSTYLEPFLNKSINDLLYPNFNNCMTITGRLSSSNPNLQNCPSKGEMGEFIQEILYAPEGWVCVSCDYSQLEIYVQAFLANDPALTNDLLSGVDFHVKRLAYAENKSYDEVYKLCKVDKLPEWDLKRSKAKVVSYQKAYGASPEKLSKTTGIALEDVKRIFEQEDIEYPNVALFNKNVMEQVVSSKQLSRSIDLPANI